MDHGWVPSICVHERRGPGRGSKRRGGARRGASSRSRGGVTRLGGGHALCCVGDPPPQLGCGYERGSSCEGGGLGSFRLDEELEV